MFCRFCGNEISDDAIFCSKCGKEVSKTGRRGEEKTMNMPVSKDVPYKEKMGVKDYFEGVLGDKQWYCTACERQVMGEKPKINWLPVIIGTIITLGFALVFYIPYRMWLPKNRCPICKSVLKPLK